MVNMAKFGRFSLVPAVGIDNDFFRCYIWW